MDRKVYLQKIITLMRKLNYSSKPGVEGSSFIFYDINSEKAERYENFSYLLQNVRAEPYDIAQSMKTNHYYRGKDYIVFKVLFNSDSTNKAKFEVENPFSYLTAMDLAISNMPDILINLQKNISNAKFIVTYEDKKYHVIDFSDVVKMFNLTKEKALALIERLNENKSLISKYNGKYLLMRPFLATSDRNREYYRTTLKEIQGRQYGVIVPDYNYKINVIEVPSTKSIIVRFTLNRIRPIPLTKDTVGEYLKYINENKIETLKLLANRGINVTNTYLTTKIRLNSSNWEHPNESIIDRSLTWADKKKTEILYNKLNLHNAYDEGYIFYLDSIDTLIQPLTIKGGCDEREHSKIIDFTNSKFYIKSVYTSCDNCGLIILARYISFGQTSIQPTNNKKAKLLRKIYKVPKGPIEYTKLIEISTASGLFIVIYNQFGVIIGQNNPNPLVKIMLIDDHYWEITDIKEKLKCKKCGKEYLETHNCNINRASYYQGKIIDQSQKYVKVRKITKTTSEEFNNVVVFDIETYVNENSVLIPYAVGYSRLDEYGNCPEPSIIYGADCFEKFVEYVIQQKNTVFASYNGSRFDTIFLVNKLQKIGVKVNNLLLTNGRVLVFDFGENNSVFDPYQFVMSSLDNACKDFDIKNAKSSFDHTKIKNIEDAFQYQSEVTPYLRLDVLALAELIVKFSDQIYDTFKVHLMDYLTLSHLAYEIWSSGLKELIEIPEQEKSDFIRQAIYGGRCYPTNKTFKTKFYDEFKKCVSDEERAKIYEKIITSKNYLYNADVSSLYPTAMSGYECMKVKYPIGVSRWSETPKNDFEAGKIGFYQIRYKPRQDLSVPILPYKCDGGLRWDLTQQEGVYTSIDIENAINNGYIIEFIGKALVYDEFSENIFSSYIEKCYKIKQDADKSGNSALRSIGKLLMNGLYGKMLQRPILENTAYCQTPSDVNKFLASNQLENFTYNDTISGIYLTGKRKKQVERCYNKPTQFGGFILAYSRRIMLNYFRAIDTTLTRPIFTYTDTDSLHITGEDYEKLLSSGYIKSSLGFLDNDIKSKKALNAVIIHEECLGPKMYSYEYLGSEGRTGTTFKAKGIMNKYLDESLFNERISKEINFKTLKRINIKRNSEQTQFEQFTIIEEDNTRTFYKTKFANAVETPEGWTPKLDAK